MARRDAEEYKRRRAIEVVETGLHRSQVEVAVDGLLKLDQGARRPLVPAVARLLRREIRKAFAARQWARLQMFASRTERENRLLTESVEGGDGAAEELEARWALLWGCGFSKDWSRARAQLEILRPRLAPAPVLARALDAWIVACGQPSREVFLEVVPQDLPAVVPSVDLRLGFERRDTARAPGPRNLDELEPIVLSCYASRPWGAFAAAVKDWVRTAPADVARGIWILAAQLSTHELVTQLPSGERRAAEPALFIARACKEAGAPPELSPEILLALKVATGFLQQGDAAGRDATAVYVPIAQVAVRYSDLVTLVVETVVGTLVLVEARQSMLELLESLVQRSASVSLWARSLRLFGLTDPHTAGPIPQWLVIGLERVLDREGELVECFRALPSKVRLGTLDILVAAMPLSLAERAFDQLWRPADDALRQDLAIAFDELLHRARSVTTRDGAASDRNIDRLVAFMATQGIDVGFDRAEVNRLLKLPGMREMMASFDDDHDDGAPLADAALVLWRRFADQLLPYGIRFLEIALVNAGSAKDERPILDRYFAGRSSIIDELQALRAAIDYPAAFRAVQTRVVSGHRGDRDTLASGLLAAKDMGAPRAVLVALARALTEADVGSTASRSATVEAALLEARLFEPRRRRQSAKPPKTNRPKVKPKRQPPGFGTKGSATPKKVRRPDQKVPSETQLELTLPKPEPKP